MPQGDGNGWAGVLQGTEDAEGSMWAGMIKHLMVVAWPTGNGNQIHASLRYAVSEFPFSIPAPNLTFL
jgi:hypothetical protein